MPGVRDEVVALITEICRPEKPDLQDDERPLLECGLDSLDFASVLITLEDRYNVAIAEDQMDQLRTLRQIVGFLEGHARA